MVRNGARKVVDERERWRIGRWLCRDLGRVRNAFREARLRSDFGSATSY